VTFNYDEIPERVCNFLMTQHKADSYVCSFTPGGRNPDWPLLAKLHGGGEAGDIIPPTWNKVLHGSIIPTWKCAYQALAEANHVRFLGYSLPISDAYAHYLFKASVMKSEHLKSIDVICLDPDGSAQRRYDEFIKFKFYRFFNANTLDYLESVREVSGANASGPDLLLNRLEVAHRQFIESRSVSSRER
jgi:hypothetical protein